jgi:hypothetical protein
LWYCLFKNFMIKKVILPQCLSLLYRKKKKYIYIYIFFFFQDWYLNSGLYLEPLYQSFSCV